ncbi:MAG: DUF881 domain-containing protein [Nocardioidaceae bacterium]|nr:DUF881 domain-containing protein [Nocardioidaceae bacterium]MCL2614229.1 DUF881 domain-containing protein [Nocardioidaceae bacterium]
MPEHLDRARTPLLTLITLESMDEDYQAASRRRGGAAEVRAGSSRGVGVLVVLLLFGMLVAVAAVQTSREAPVEDASRQSLIDRINDHRRSVARTQQRLADLRDANTKADGELAALGARLNAAQGRATDLGALTGFQPVTGPALRVSLDNAKYADQNDEIRDSDIGLLVDGLWGAGAEAITVNGQRVTARTGIRTSGAAIEVNGVGVAPPYTILAIGNTDQMSADFLNSAAGQAFVALAGQYDFRYDLHDVGQVRMAAAPTSLTRLRSATSTKADSSGRKHGKTHGKKDKRGGNG